MSTMCMAQRRSLAAKQQFFQTKFLHLAQFSARKFVQNEDLVGADPNVDMFAENVLDLPDINRTVSLDGNPNLLKPGRSDDSAGGRILDLRHAPHDFLDPVTGNLDATAVDDV